MAIGGGGGGGVTLHWAHPSPVDHISLCSPGNLCSRNGGGRYTGPKISRRSCGVHSKGPSLCTSGK